jgi:cyclopropane-fatty-acyl-phospholipid synthase
MSDSLSLDQDAVTRPPAAKPCGPAAFALRKLLAHFATGRFSIVTPDGTRIEHGAPEEGPDVVMVLHRWRSLRRLLTGGGVGFAEGYIAGEWSSPDLVALIELMAANAVRLERVIKGFAPMRAWNRLYHLLRANSRAGSRRNIAFHYDLGNDFYRLWLDSSLTYSSALYGCAGLSLEAAQEVKQQRILDLLDLGGRERVLEIGCGWGALAVRLARQASVVTALTLSAQQQTHAAARVAAEGLADKIDVRLQDYRDAGGLFDRIVSIEMLEAVGEKYWPIYFATLRRRLRQGGRIVLQAITIVEDRFDMYRRSPDFIQRYIFPGGMLPHRAAIEQQAARAGLTLVAVETFGASYATTLGEWRRRFLAAWPEVEALGFSPSFRRLWEYYLSYCEAGFRAGVIDVGLYTFTG